MSPYFDCFSFQSFLACYMIMPFELFLCMVLCVDYDMFLLIIIGVSDCLSGLGVEFG